MKDEQRWVELESRLAFQEEHIHQLTLTLTRQQRMLDALLGQMRELRRQLAAMAPHSPLASDPEGPPPHY